ncbi:hypothetical protein [Streptomyces sp. NPDC052042]|uniref:hypothetical protein n=1 Tax=Streptomyces sp. NPDC052042 TaxID=3365683 RepID=UPI0037D19964
MATPFAARIRTAARIGTTARMGATARDHTARLPATACARLIGVLRRLADSSLDNPVLHVSPGPTPIARPRAHRHTVRTPDRTVRLEATWHPEP